MNQVWQIIISDGWAGFFRIFAAILISMEAFVLVSAMEDMIVVWDAIFKSKFVQTLDGNLDLGDQSDRVDHRKLDRLDLGRIQWVIKHIGIAVSRLKGNQDTVIVMSEEFLAIHQKIKDILIREKISITNLIKDF